MTNSSPRAQARFRVLAIATVVALYLQIVIGGVVRITGSGEACTGWPLCSGHVIPPFNTSVLIEYSHRTVGLLSILLVAATMVAAFWVHRTTPRLCLAAAATFVLVIVQALLGGITVLLGLPPTAILLHLGNAMLVLGSALLVALWSGRVAQPVRRETSEVVRRLFGWTAATALVAVLSGAYVVGAGASAACSAWPLCGAGQSTGADIHMLHRLVVGLCSVVILTTAHLARLHWRGTSLEWIPWATALALLGEAWVGLLQVVSGLPAALRGMHLALATAVWAGAVMMAIAVRLETGEPLPVPKNKRAPARKLTRATS